MPQKMMNGCVRVSLYLPEKLVKRIDSVRGDIPRSKYITRQLETGAMEAGVEAL
jgi:metal-responsive CopG/Arc/MetJ family transcriptional regulator